MGVKYNTFVRFYSICTFPFLSFLILAIAYSLNAWTDFNSWWLKRRGLSQGSALQASVFRNFHFFGVIFLKNLKNFVASAEIPAKTKMLNNFLLA